MIPSLPQGQQQEWVPVNRSARELSAGTDANLTSLAISPERSEIKLVLPPTTPEPLYYTRDHRGWAFGNDLRFLMRWAGDDFDEHAIFAILQYGAVPPPFTFARGIFRAPNGHILTLCSTASEPSLECWYEQEVETNTVKSQGDPASQFVPTLDRLLSGIPESAVLYFSGGVDSGLLASRLARLGRSDVHLFNLSFGEGDPESELAQQMAAYLGLRYERVLYRLEHLADLLDGLASTYSFPFCDLSTLPTYLLIRGSLVDAGTSGVILEGTGADGAFGIGLGYRFWKWLYRVPYPARWLAAETYRWCDLWKADDTSPAERLGRIARRSVQMPLSHAGVIAANSLNGIFYSMRAEVGRALTRAIEERVEVLSSGLEPRDRFSFLDMVHVCAGIYAAKSFDPLRLAGIRAVYPFLEPSTVRIAFSMGWDEKCWRGERKYFLKNLLAQSVPQAMVFRPKSGFLPPVTKILAHPTMQDFFANVVLSPDNPLLHFFREEEIRAGTGPIETGRICELRGLQLSMGSGVHLRLVSAAKGCSR